MAADFTAFALEVMEEWPSLYPLEPTDIQRMAVKHGLLRPAPAGYVPGLHTDAVDGAPKKGDPWFEKTYTI